MGPTKPSKTPPTPPATCLNHERPHSDLKQTASSYPGSPGEEPGNGLRVHPSLIIRARLFRPPFFFLSPPLSRLAWGERAENYSFDLTEPPSSATLIHKLLIPSTFYYKCSSHRLCTFSLGPDSADSPTPFVSCPAMHRKSATPHPKASDFLRTRPATSATQSANRQSAPLFAQGPTTARQRRAQKFSARRSLQESSSEDGEQFPAASTLSLIHI